MNPTWEKRLRRLQKHGHPELVKAFEAGEISARSVRYFVRLSKPQQLAELRARQNVLRQHRCRCVTELINDYLNNHTVVDLEGVREILAL